MLALQKKTLAAVNGNVVPETDFMPIDCTTLLAFINPKVFATNHAGFFKLGGNYGGMGGLSATSGQQSLSPGYFLDVFRNGILAYENQDGVGIFLSDLLNIFPGKNRAS